MTKFTGSIGLYSNSLRDEGYRYAEKAAWLLRSRGIEPLLVGDEEALHAKALDLKTARTADVDCIVTLGGDGTLLQAAKEAALSGIPVMGINLGHLGYLTDAASDDWEDALTRLLAGKCTTEKRIMLEADVEGQKGRALALNDAFVSYSGAIKLLTLKVEINGEHMDTYQADGILVSTPTGSTAYNLSAGGPVIKPDMDIFAITPVCPHALHVRSAVVSANDIVTIRVLSQVGGALHLDGINAAHIPKDGCVNIRRSPHHAKIIKTRPKGFYTTLREKMNWN